jgi:hypothetical protein
LCCVVVWCGVCEYRLAMVEEQDVFGAAYFVVGCRARKVPSPEGMSGVVRESSES